ncbi:MAG: alpha/beta fold hydrolase [Hyphomonas sp.]
MLIIRHRFKLILAGLASGILAACSGEPAGSADILREADLPDGPRVQFEVHAAPSLAEGSMDLVLVPGLSSPASVWDAVTAALEGEARIHLAQLAGYAGTAPVRTRNGVLADAQADIEAYLETCCPGGAVVAGHSLGGTIALAAAHNRPDLVRRVVVIDARPNAGGPPNAMLLNRRAAGTRDGVLSASDAAFAAEVRKQAADMFATDPADVDRIVQWSLDSHRPTVAQSLYELTLADQRPLHSAVVAPVTVLAAWHADRGFTFEESTTYWGGLFSELPNGEVRLVRDARHFIMLDQPEALVLEIRRLLQR